MKTLFLLVLLLTGPEPLILSNDSGQSTYKTNIAHHYHGILWSIEDSTGSYFYRNNKRCILYTKAFNKWYEEKGKKR